MKMTDVKEKTPNKRKSLVNNDSSAKKAKFTPQPKQNGTPKAQNKKTPAKKSPATESKAALNKLKNSLQGDKKAETIAVLTKKIQEIESKGATSKSAKKKLDTLRKLLSEAGGENTTQKSVKKGKKNEVKVEDEVENEEVESDDEAEDEEESDDDNDEEEEEEEDSEEAEKDDEEEESEEGDEPDETEAKKQKAPAKKQPNEKPQIYFIRENCVFVRVPISANDAAIKEHFKEVGNITSVNVLMNKFTGEPYGRAYIQLGDKESFVKCFNFHGTTWDETLVTVHPAENRRKKSFNKNFRGKPPGQGRPNQKNFPNKTRPNFTPNKRNFNNFGPKVQFDPKNKNKAN